MVWNFRKSVDNIFVYWRFYVFFFSRKHSKNFSNQLKFLWIILEPVKCKRAHKNSDHFRAKYGTLEFRNFLSTRQLAPQTRHFRKQRFVIALIRNVKSQLPKQRWSPTQNSNLLWLLNPSAFVTPFFSFILVIFLCSRSNRAGNGKNRISRSTEYVRFIVVCM